MVAGHLQEKNGIYYVVLTYKTYDGKRKTKWQSTGLPIKGNKRRAEAMMRELQDDFEPPVDPNGPPSKAMLFADYLVQWLEIAKSTVKLTTYASYRWKNKTSPADYSGQIQALTARIRELRREIATCADIEMDREMVQDKVQRAKQPEKAELQVAENTHYNHVCAYGSHH